MGICSKAHLVLPNKNVENGKENRLSFIRLVIYAMLKNILLIPR